MELLPAIRWNRCPRCVEYAAFVSTKPDGMGLGLSISRTIVEGQGGRIRAGAGPGGRGTAVWFTLPAAGARERAGDG